MNSLQQQARFDDFVQEFNTERPHEALAMKCPAEIYAASSRPYSGLPDLTYPLHDRDILGRRLEDGLVLRTPLRRFKVYDGCTKHAQSRLWEDLPWLLNSGYRVGTCWA